jgi:hypothetical protein
MPSQAEQAFSDIAYSFLQSSNIDIDKHLIGFEIAHENESGSKLIGFFVLRIGGEYYYVPVIFLNGNIKPLVMMIANKKNQFMNLDNDWVQYLDSRKVPQMGHGVRDPKVPDTYNIQDFFLPPYATKSASSRDLFPALLEKSSSLAKIAFGKLIRNNEKLCKGLVNTYGWDVIKSAMSSLEKYPQKSKSGKRDIVLVDDMQQAKSLPLKQKIEFQKNGYVIIDNRDQKKLIKSAETTKGIGMSSASEACEADVMTNKGKRRLVLFPDFIQTTSFYSEKDKPQSPFCMFIDKDSKNVGYERSIEILYPEETKTPITDIDGSVPVDKMDRNKRYLIFGQNRSGAWRALEPIWVNSRNQDSDGSVFFGTNGQTILVKSDGDLSFMGKDIVVPKRFRAVPIDGNDEIKILGINSVFMGLNYSRDLVEYRGSSCLGGDLYKNSEFMERCESGAHAKVALMRRYNLTKTAAEEIIAGGKYWVKKALDMSQPMAPGYAYNMFPGGASSYGESYQEVGGLNGSRQRPQLWQPPNDQQAVQNDIRRAIQLSEMGAKDVFDKAMIGVLSKISDVDSEIRSLLPEYTQAIDKLGRQIFLMWVKPEEIREKYDINSFMETETVLLDTFKNMGKIVLDIRKKYGQ